MSNTYYMSKTEHRQITPLAVLVPTRSRPDNLARLLRVRTNCTTWAVVLDRDDPKLDDYLRVLGVARGNGVNVRWMILEDRMMLGQKLNVGVEWLVHWDEVPTNVGYMGDDHLPLTSCWDIELVDTLAKPDIGYCYPDDGWRGEQLATCVFAWMPAVQAAGYLAAPGIQHLFVDDAWMALAREAGCLEFVRHIRIDHLHPHAGKAPTDEQYTRVNSDEQMTRDRAAYTWWCDNEMHEASERVREAMKDKTDAAI